MSGLLIILLFYINFYATGPTIGPTIGPRTFYISSSSGNDGNNGTQPTPWQTLSKINITTFNPGDSILLKSGDTWNGTIKPLSNGIIIGSYGAGAKPKLSGFTTLSGWSNIGGNIWECNAPTLKSNCNAFTIDGIPYAVGRTPNNSYYTYQSSSTSQLVSSTLTGTPSYVGAEVVIRKIAYVIQRGKITAQSGSTLTYVKTENIEPATSFGLVNGNSGHGFFLQRFVGSLDQFGEWYYNKATGKMRMFSGANPAANVIKASYIDTLIDIGSRTNITIENLSLEGAGRYGVYSKDGSYIVVKNCDFDNNTLPVAVHNTLAITVDNCTLNNSFNNAIYVYNAHNRQITITNNTVTNTGLLLGMAAFYSNANCTGIYVHGDTISNSTNFLNVLNNRVITTGYNGIRFQGSNVLVSRNVVDTFCTVLDDGGGIYTYMDQPTEPNSNRVVEYNFVSNSVGAAAGAGGSQSSCQYNDGFTKNVISRYNTYWNITGTLKGNGVQTSNPVNVLIRNNTIYNTDVCINTNHITYTSSPIPPISNTIVDSNILYQKTNQTTKWIVRHINTNLTNPPMTIQQSLGSWIQNNNWISNQQANSYTYYYSATGNGVYSPYLYLMLTQWRGSPYLHDINSVLPPVTLTNTNTNLHINPSDTPKVVSFVGLSKIDPKGNVYNNIATVPEWSSLLLIDNGASSSNSAPTANAGLNIPITLPTSTTTLTGSGTDPEGGTMTYLWVKIAGPSGGTLVTAGSPSSTIFDLEEGTYTYRLTVTDNAGATDFDDVNVIVGPATAPGNILPVANAGSNIAIVLPITSTTLNGSGTDADGTIASYDWTQISGPSTAAIVTANAATTVINSLIPGVYKFLLEITDNLGGIGTDTVQVTLNTAPSNILPVANAGIDITITFPANSLTLTGSGTDVDGTISSYSWVKISGSEGGIIESGSSATTVISGLEVGVYVFELTVTDNSGGVATNTVQVTVNAAPIQRCTNCMITNKRFINQ